MTNYLHNLKVAVLKNTKLSDDDSEAIRSIFDTVDFMEDYMLRTFNLFNIDEQEGIMAYYSELIPQLPMEATNILAQMSDNMHKCIKEEEEEL